MHVIGSDMLGMKSLFHHRSAAACGRTSFSVVPVLLGVGSLLARFQLTEGPSKPAPLAVQFTSEGSTLSGCDIELAGPGYRFSLIKKRFAAGQYYIVETTRHLLNSSLNMIISTFL